MTFIQHLLTSVLPHSWADNMRTESLSWVLRCPSCGFERSVWETGSIRWKATGNPRRLMACSQCGQRTWHTLYRKPGL
jgi:transcription elongation factor Elf1